MTFRLPLLALLVCAAALLLAAGQVTASDVQVTASLDRDTIGSDEQAVLQVEVRGMEQTLPAPQMPALGMFDVYSQGRSSSVSIINGQVEAAVTYRYVIVPKKPGVYPIENIVVVHKNKRYVGNKVELTVLDRGTAAPDELEGQARDESGRSRDFFLEASVDKADPYVNEQVTLTLRFYIGVQYFSTPDLTEPTMTGFWPELLGNKPQYNQKLNNRTYRVFERKYALFPIQTGELTIGRAMVSTTVAAKRRSRDPFDVFGDVFGRGQEVTVRSNPIKINVRPVPQEGRPGGYSGTVGRFGITAQANKRDIEVNQPVTVTFKITGEGNVKTVAEPVIEDSDEFRVYRASSSENITKLNDRVGGTKIFEEVFIPKRPGSLEIPGIAISFFDPRSGRFNTVKTDPIGLRVKKAEGYAALPDSPDLPAGVEIGSETRDIRYIMTDIGDPAPVGRLVLFSPLYLAVNGVPVLVLLGLVVMRAKREKLAKDVGYARSRAASRQARKRLSKAQSLASIEQAGEFYGELASALVRFVADKLNRSPHGLTSDQIVELLAERKADEKLLDDTRGFLRKCDFARYAPSSVTQDSMRESLSEAEQLIVRVEGLRFEG